MLIARAGLVIPADRRVELLVSFADLKAEIARLHSPLPASLEPASVYRPDVVEAAR